MVDFDDAADRLYAAGRDEFTALRAELVKAAAGAGDKEVSAAIGKLTKPTTAGWLVNRVAREQPELVDELVELGADLRAAHARMAGEEIRQLSAERRRIERRLLDAVRDASDRAPGDSVVREVEEILSAAITDPTAARVVQLGRVTSAREVRDEPGWPMITATDGLAPRRARRAKAAQPTADEQPTAKSHQERQADRARKAERARLVKKAERDLAAARESVKQAEVARTESERTVVDAERAAEEAAADAQRLRQELADAQQREASARDRAHQARRAVKQAERSAGQAWRLLQEAERRLEELSVD